MNEQKKLVDITELTDDQLKDLSYNLLGLLQLTQSDLDMLSKEIARRAKAKQTAYEQSNTTSKV